jgi:hypothetical protein
MLKATEECSWEFNETTRLLDPGSDWRGTFGELAVKLGMTSRSALLAVRLVASYARRHPTWDTSRVYKKP